MKTFLRSILYTSVILIFFSLQLRGQNSPEEIKVYQEVLVYTSDTLPVMHIPSVNIYDESRFSYLKSRRYRRKIYNVKKAYHYAIVANKRLIKLDKQLSQIDSKRERKKVLNEQEKAIMDEFEDDLRKMSVTQGIILVKLVDRETGNTSYEVIKDLRGGVTAFFWQGIARIFGNDLKLQYDPEGRDKLIEDIILATEMGFI